MAYNIVSVKCPSCGSRLPVEQGRSHLFCSYCGASVIVSNENEQIFRHIDEASIKQTEADTILRIKELEIEEREKERIHERRRIIYYLLAVLVVVVVALVLLVPGFEWFLFVILMFIGMGWMIHDSQKR